MLVHCTKVLKHAGTKVTAMFKTCKYKWYKEVLKRTSTKVTDMLKTNKKIK